MKATLLFVAVAFAGCQAASDGGGGSPGTGATQTGDQCVESTLVAQCPPGSSPDLSAAAVSACEGRADFLLDGDGGSVRAACRGAGQCLVVCNFDAPCQCGVDSITTEGVFCTPCSQASSCGNSVCEGGEDPTNCPLDCAASCQTGMQRCNGRDREDCNGQGQWSKVECRSDQSCQLGPGGVACLPDLSPSGGTYAGTGWQDVRLPADPADIYFAAAEIANCPEGNCQPLAWIDDTHLLGFDSGQLSLLSTDAGTPEPLQLQADATKIGVDLPWVIAAGRQPGILNVQTRQRRDAEAVVDDVTPLTWGAAAVDAAHARGAVSFAAAGEPFVALYDLETGQIEVMLRYAAPGFPSAAASLAFSPDGTLLAELRPEGRCIVWNVEERRHTRLIDLEGSGQGAPAMGAWAAFTRGEGPFLLLSTSGALEVWNLDTPERVRRSGQARDDQVGGVFSVSPDGRIVAAQGMGGLALHSLSTLETIRTLSVVPAVGTGDLAAFSPDGRRLAVGNLVFTSWSE